MTKFDQRNQQIETQYNAGRDINVHLTPDPMDLIRDKRNRAQMLERVRAFWIGGVLEPSMQDAPRLVLKLCEQPDLVENPWRLTLQEVDQSARSLPAGTPITQVYDEAKGELLILGEPGCGKTTLLLELARDLLNRGEHDDSSPVPVVFNLSSWAQKRQPLTDWLVEELHTKYQVSRKLGQPWIDADQVLPLLDGLDEVAQEHRASCLEAINAYRREHGLLPTVVCSRSAEYLDLSQKTRILLRSTIVAQPLTWQQVDEYLSSAGEQVDTLRVVLQNDPVMQELATTPLMLRVLALTSQGRAIDDLSLKGSLETQRRQVFATYVDRMLQRRSVQTRYTRQQTMHWLIWLALQMGQHSQTVFSIERMQPNWLSGNRLSRLYSILVGGLISGLVGGLFFGLGSAVDGVRPLSALFIALFWGLLGGLVCGLIPGLEKAEIKPVEEVVWSWRRMWRSISKYLRQSLLFVLLPLGLLIGLLAGIGFGLNNRLLTGLLLGPLVGLIVVVFGGLACGLAFGVPIGLLGGFARRRLDEHNRVRPNQGIWRSAHNALFIGLLASLLPGLPISLLSLLFSGSQQLHTALITWLFWGLGPGLVFGLLYGGFACIQHGVLRLLLWCTRSVPWNYPRFLDHATERILLRKVGGSYIFVHRLLLEYFASLSPASTPDVARNLETFASREVHDEVREAAIESVRSGLSARLTFLKVLLTMVVGGLSLAVLGEYILTRLMGLSIDSSLYDGLILLFWLGAIALGVVVRKRSWGFVLAICGVGIAITSAMIAFFYAR